MKRVLCFGSHPDDIEIGCGGTLAKLVLQGFEATFVVLTSGEAGSDSIAPGELRTIREAEAVRAAGRLGVSDVRFFRFADGLMHLERSMRLQTIEVIRAVRPQIVFTHASSDEFPDHALFSRLTFDAVAAARGPWFSEVAGSPHAVPSVYGYEVWNPLPRFQTVSDITGTLQLKLSALSEHRSQLKSIHYDRAIRGLNQYRGEMTGVGEYAEVFEVLQSALE